MKKTQTAIAKATGYSVRHMNRFFRKVCLPPVPVAKKIEKIAGIPWQSWYEDKPPDLPRMER